MPYIKISSEEERKIKKTVLEALAASVKTQNTALKLFRLKRSKKPAMTGVATSLKETGQELEKIKQVLPTAELPELEKRPRPAKPAARPGAKPKARTKYERELEAIKEKISKIG